MFDLSLLVLNLLSVEFKIQALDSDVIIMNFWLVVVWLVFSKKCFYFMKGLTTQCRNIVKISWPLKWMTQTKKLMIWWWANLQPIFVGRQENKIALHFLRDNLKTQFHKIKSIWQWKFPDRIFSDIIAHNLWSLNYSQ